MTEEPEYPEEILCNHPLAYYWIMLKTLKDQNCTYLETCFQEVDFAFGTYRGTGCVMGTPGKIRNDHDRFLKKLEPHKKPRRQNVTLTISDCGYRYQTDSGLRVIISRGINGHVFDKNTRLIGFAEGPSTAWIQLQPKEVDDDLIAKRAIRNARRPRFTKRFQVPH